MKRLSIVLLVGLIVGAATYNINAARLPVPGADNNNWADILNTYLLVAHEADGTVKAGSIGSEDIDVTDAFGITSTIQAYSKTQTGALDDAVYGNATSFAKDLVDDLSGVSDVSTARSNLSVYSQSEVDTITESFFNITSATTLTADLTLLGAPSSGLHAATKTYVDSQVASGIANLVSRTTFTNTSSFFHTEYIGQDGDAPARTEGFAIFSTTYTPDSGSNILELSVNLQWGYSTSLRQTITFWDGTVLVGIVGFQPGVGVGNWLNSTNAYASSYVAGAGARTIMVRVGNDAVGNFYLNRVATEADPYGYGNTKTNFIIKEYLP